MSSVMYFARDAGTYSVSVGSLQLWAERIHAYKSIPPALEKQGMDILHAGLWQNRTVRPVPLLSVQRSMRASSAVASKGRSHRMCAWNKCGMHRRPYMQHIVRLCEGMYAAVLRGREVLRDVCRSSGTHNRCFRT